MLLRTGRRSRKESAQFDRDEPIGNLFEQIIIEHVADFPAMIGVLALVINHCHLRGAKDHLASGHLLIIASSKSAGCSSPQYSQIIRSFYTSTNVPLEFSKPRCGKKGTSLPLRQNILFCPLRAITRIVAGGSAKAREAGSLSSFCFCRPTNWSVSSQASFFDFLVIARMVTLVIC